MMVACMSVSEIYDNQSILKAASIPLEQNQDEEVDEDEIDRDLETQIDRDRMNA
jgi:hypothetical protein